MSSFKVTTLPVLSTSRRHALCPHSWSWCLLTSWVQALIQFQSVHWFDMKSSWKSTWNLKALTYLSESVTQPYSKTGSTCNSVLNLCPPPQIATICTLTICTLTICAALICGHQPTICTDGLAIWASPPSLLTKGWFPSPCFYVLPWCSVVQQ